MQSKKRTGPANLPDCHGRSLLIPSSCRMSDKKSTPEMLADLLREAGMLILVFLGVDLMFIEHPPSWMVVGLGAVMGVFCIYLGVNLERKRE